MAKKKTSGLEKIPPFITRPLWKDGFVWIGIGTVLFWILVIWYLLT
jgi:hypothetical protein